MLAAMCAENDARLVRWPSVRQVAHTKRAQEARGSGVGVSASSVARGHGRYQLWPNEVWPSCFTKLGQTICGNTIFGQHQLWPKHGVGPFRWGPTGGPFRGGSLRWGDSGGAQRVGGPNFALFHNPATIVFLSSLTWGSSRHDVLKRQDPQMCTFGVLGLSCEAPTALRTHTCTFGLGLQNTTPIPREDPQEREERMKSCWRVGKSEILGRSGGGWCCSWRAVRGSLAGGPGDGGSRENKRK